MSTKAEVARKRAAKGARQVEAAEKEGCELAVDVLRQCMVAFRDVAEAFRPGSRRRPNKGANLVEFEKWSKLVLRACELLAPFESPKALVPPAPDAIEAVEAKVEVSVDLTTLSNEELIRYYRSRIAAGPVAPPAIAPPLPSPQPDAAPSLPVPVVTGAPVEVEEPAEKLQPIVGEPAAEQSAEPANVIPATVNNGGQLPRRWSAPLRV